MTTPPVAPVPGTPVRPAPAPARPAPAAGRTMMGLPGQLPGASAAATPAAPAPLAARAEEPRAQGASATPAGVADAPKARSFSQKTMLGMTSPFVSGPPQPLHGKPTTEAAAPARATAASPAVQASKPVSPVAFSAPAVPSAPSPRPSAEEAHASAPGAPVPTAPTGSPAAGAGPTPKHTMLGVAPPAAVAAAIRAANVVQEATSNLASNVAAAQASAAAPLPASIDPRQAAEAFAAKPVPPRAPEVKKTMVGVAPAPPAPKTPDDASSMGISSTLPPPPAPAASPENKVAAQTDRTMLGMPVAAQGEAPSAQAGVGSDHGARAFTAPSELDEFSRRDSNLPGPPSTARAVLAAVAGALLVLALGLALWHFLGGTDLAVQVVQGDDGELLQVEVPSAEPGAKVRFLGAEQELHGGVAKFPLTADALALGDNDLSIGVVRAGEVKATNVSLHVAYRARVDLAGLSKDPPTLDVVVDALPGSRVEVDGQAVKLDARGRGVKRYPVAAQTGSKLAFSARYAIHPPEGAAAEGTLTLNLPVSSLQIDRPGANVTTDQSSIEVAGAVENLAQVTVDGQSVKVTDGRFLHKVKLATAGQHTIHVLARVAGKAPRAVDVSVTRVADLTLAAASFKPDASLNYARIAQNPVIYRGQKVAFDGRVYNVEVKGSASHLQMLVRDCPGTQRCPLWVELPQATDATVNSWVRVLGTVAGEQQFRSERNQVHTVPSVTAQYVLKLAR